MYVCMYVYIYIYVYTHICINKYIIYIYMYVCTHILQRLVGSQALLKHPQALQLAHLCAELIKVVACHAWPCGQ